MPNPAQVKSIQALWDTIDADFGEMGEALLTELFNTHPDTKALFSRVLSKPDVSAAMRTHGGKIIRKLDVSIGQLDCPDVLAEDLSTLGARHPGYGVIPNRHNRPFRNALFKVIQKYAKGTFDQAAWDKAFNLFMGCMGLFSD